ncbi:hypothetical protein F8388_000434 [Cannabis sativa]|uniref:Uncharacterized protein n=1 Tax=Cannabis sativa TaxID=3483 RepID=A0A7J6F1G9_CANSA|nr:hypothetical protein F8388_000434 [Cannabis sativa]
MANSNLPRRIIKLRELCASPSEDNMRYFNVMTLAQRNLLTKINVPFRLSSVEMYFLVANDRGVFKLELFLPEEYPMAAPRFGFSPRYIIQTLTARQNLSRYLERQMESCSSDTNCTSEHSSTSQCPKPRRPSFENIASIGKVTKLRPSKTAKEWTPFVCEWCIKAKAGKLFPCLENNIYWNVYVNLKEKLGELMMLLKMGA